MYYWVIYISRYDYVLIYIFINNIGKIYFLIIGMNPLNYYDL